MDGVALTVGMSPLAVAWRLGVAALCGLAVGVERERSGHTPGAHPHFAGIRTFLLMGLGSGAAGVLLATGSPLRPGCCWPASRRSWWWRMRAAP